MSALSWLLMCQSPKKPAGISAVTASLSAAADALLHASFAMQSLCSQVDSSTRRQATAARTFRLTVISGTALSELLIDIIKRTCDTVWCRLACGWLQLHQHRWRPRRKFFDDSTNLMVVSAPGDRVATVGERWWTREPRMSDVGGDA